MGGENQVGVLKRFMSRFGKACEHDWWVEDHWQLDEMDVVVEACTRCGALSFRELQEAR